MKNFLKQLWLLLSMNCETSANLTSDSFDRELNWAEHWGIKCHRIVCKPSRVLERQMKYLNDKIVDSVESDSLKIHPGLVSDESEFRLSDDARTRILLRIRETQ